MALKQLGSWRRAMLACVGAAIVLAGCASGPQRSPAAAATPAGAAPTAGGPSQSGLVQTSGMEEIMPQPASPGGGPAYPGAAPGAPGAAAPGGVQYAGGPVAPVQPVPAPAVTPASPPTTADKPKPEDEDAGFDWGDLAPDVTWKKMMKALGYGPDEPKARAAFAEGESLFRQKKYAEAAPLFHTATWRWPDSPMEEDAMFLEGESLFFNDQYGKAQDAYDVLLKKHTNTRYMDTVMWRLFAIGHYWEQLEDAHPHWPTTPNLTDKKQPTFDTWDNAIAAYEAVHQNDPRGPLADSAEMAVANMNFRAKHFEEAANHYDIIRKEYPRSKYQLQAHILGLHCKMAVYQGPLYTPQPLKDAAEIADQTLKQFRGQLGPEEERVRQSRALIEVRRAEREWAMGQYYEQRKYYKAAKNYYQYVLDHYAQTPYADQARARLGAIRDQPDTPPNHFKWLTQVFDHER